MKIMVLADKPEAILWEHLDKRRLEGIELIISCGDLPAEYLSFLTCFTHAPILYVHGNHDTRYENNPPDGCVCIEDSIYVHDGLRVLGLGGSMRYKKYALHQYTEREMKKRVFRLRWKILHRRGFDILVAHAPAFGQGDQEDLPHRGFRCFLHLMDRFKPSYFVHGHVHSEYNVMSFRRERVYKSTTIVNACGYYVIEVPTPPQGRKLHKNPL